MVTFTTDFSQFFDGVINLITAIGVIIYIFIMNFSKSKNSLQKRFIFFLVLVGTLCLTRGLNYIFDSNLTVNVEKITLYISSLIPISLLLLFELLMRKHFHYIIKFYVLLSSFFLLVLFIFNPITKPLVMLLMSDYIIIFFVFTYIVLSRNRDELTGDENKLLDTVSIISILIIPLIISDFRTVIKWDVIRLGAMGILFFIYTLINVWNAKSFTNNLSKLGSLILLNIVFAFIIAFVFGLMHLFCYVLVLVIMVRMLIHILTTAHESYSKTSQEMIVTLLDAFSNPAMDTKAIKAKLAEDEMILVSESDLQHYNPTMIAKFFEKNGIYFKNEIRKLSQVKSADKNVYDEIRHLYEDFDCNACIYTSFSYEGKEEFFLIFFKWPALAPKTKLHTEIKIISNLCAYRKSR
jgi:hypothetical protein